MYVVLVTKKLKNTVKKKCQQQTVAVLQTSVSVFGEMLF